MKAGLHNHTLFSDGAFEPSYVLELGLRDLDYVAITDHDSVLGVVDFNHPKLIKGIELSSTYNGSLVHLLGFFKGNKVPTSLIEFSKNFLKVRFKRAFKMLKNCVRYFHCKVNFKLLDEYQDRALSRKNLSDILIQSNPDIAEEVLDSYLSSSSKAYIPVSNMSAFDGVEFLKQNNCLCFLAHPGRIKNLENRNYLLNNLPLDGIEVFYPTHSADFREELLGICKRRNLLVSGGSDFHSLTKGISPAHCYLEEPYLTPFLEALYGNKKSDLS